jgi:hypothetical protein
MGAVLRRWCGQAISPAVVLESARVGTAMKQTRVRAQVGEAWRRADEAVRLQAVTWPRANIATVAMPTMSKQACLQRPSRVGGQPSRSRSHAAPSASTRLRTVLHSVTASTSSVTSAFVSGRSSPGTCAWRPSELVSGHAGCPSVPRPQAHALTSSSFCGVVLVLAS